MGLSGGVDSAVSCALSVKALGNENVTTILMPEIGVTSEANIRDAESLAKNLKIRHYVIPVNDFVSNFQKINKKFGFRNENFALANTKARARMMILYYYANINKALVVGTSNKSEAVLGYATKHGDNAVDVQVIGDLWKTQVIELAKELGIPEQIIEKTPTAELVAGQTDEGELGAPYPILDKILKLHFEDKKSKEEIIKIGFDSKLVEGMFERIRQNKHKGTGPVVLKIS